MILSKRTILVNAEDFSLFYHSLSLFIQKDVQRSFAIASCVIFRKFRIRLGLYFVAEIDRSPRLAPRVSLQREVA